MHNELIQYFNITHGSLVLCLEIDGYIFVSEVTFASWDCSKIFAKKEYE